MNNTKNSTVTVRVACAIVFLVFVFCYIYCFQTDLLAFAQHVWAGGKTRWNAFVGAAVITLLLYLVHVAVSSLSRMPQRVESLTYLPSFLLLSALTGISPDSSVGIPLVGVNTWVCLLLFPLSLLLIKVVEGDNQIKIPRNINTHVSKVSLCNFGVLALLMLLTIGLSNTDRTLHLRLKMERHINEKMYDDALKMAKMGDANDSSMTMFCALALSKRGLLGENFFEYPVVMSSSALLPKTNALYSSDTDNMASWKDSRFIYNKDEVLWRQLGGIPAEKVTSTVDFLHLLQRKNVARPAVPDYILTAYLMDGQLKEFVSEIGKYYDLNTDKLPKHYKEALVLYTHLHSNRILTYENSTLDADYVDFLKLERMKYSTHAERDYALRKAYLGTYWHYYYQKTKCKNHR